MPCVWRMASLLPLVLLLLLLLRLWLVPLLLLLLPLLLLLLLLWLLLTQQASLLETARGLSTVGPVERRVHVGFLALWPVADARGSQLVALWPWDAWP